MNIKNHLPIFLIFLLVLSIGAGQVLAQDSGSETIQAALGSAFTYQGQLKDSDGNPITAICDLSFGLWDAGSTGTQIGGLSTILNVQVVDGYFTARVNEADSFGNNAFNGEARWLEIAVRCPSGSGDYTTLTPRQEILAAPYAAYALSVNDGAGSGLDADTVDGLHASELGIHYQNVVVVAKSGGDYTSVQTAIDSITNAAADNAYLVWVAPGVYTETVTMKSFVHLQGASQEATVITSAASSSAWPPDHATLTLASDVSLRDLTLGNSGSGNNNAALLATAGMTRTLVADVTAHALGEGVNNLAIFLTGSGTGITLQQVTAIAENASDLNSGFISHSGATATLRGGTFTGRGGTNAWAIFASGSGTDMEAESVIALSENGSSTSIGLYNYNGAATTLSGGAFTGRGGTQAIGVQNTLTSTLTAGNITAIAEDGSDNYGLSNYDGGSVTVHDATISARGGTNTYALYNETNVTLEAKNVTTLAENGSSANYGLRNVDNAQATICGGSFVAQGGTDAYGIYNDDSSTTLEATGVTARAEGASGSNYGLYNYTGASTTAHSGAFTARGGNNAIGIYNAGNGATLEVESITALAEDGGSTNRGLYNGTGAAAILCGSSFIGRSDGSSTFGIYNNYSALEAEGVTALAENSGSSANSYGLYNNNGAAAVLHGGSFTARGGSVTNGIYNYGSSTTLDAKSVTALGENSSSVNYGLYNYNGATATLRGGSFTARGGSNTNGIYNYGINATLKTESVTTLGENGSSTNYGLINSYSATAILYGGSFIGRGGSNARGIENSGSGATLNVKNATLLGEDGSSTNYGLYNTDSSTTTNVYLSVLEGASNSIYRGSGSVTISNCQLVGGAVSGTVTCVLVTRGTTISTDGSTCP